MPSTPLPAEVVVAASAVVAALLTGVIAAVTLTLGKEQKVSEMRQAWIDGLRSEIATFFSSYRFVATAIRNHWDQTQNDATYSHQISDQSVSEASVRASESLYRIKLRLNGGEAEHTELERLLVGVESSLSKTPDGDLSVRDNVVQAIDRAEKQARTVLKLEWSRVKRGEPAFVNLRKWVAPAIIALVTGFAAILVSVTYR